ncbi:MAG: hypothetical protein PHT58_03705 [Eubacteriales bacterium]|nr:hypothetical protein [Eubacteriales bacterium]
MTGQDIYIMASALLYERNNEDMDSKDFSIPFLNLLMQEALPVENSIRFAKGEAQLDSAPYLTSLDETIAYSDEILRGALPYGLAARFFTEAMDNYNAAECTARYVNALNSATRFTEEPITDIYGGAQ